MTHVMKYLVIETLYLLQIFFSLQRKQKKSNIALKTSLTFYMRKKGIALERRMKHLHVSGYHAHSMEAIPLLEEQSARVCTIRSVILPEFDNHRIPHWKGLQGSSGPIL